MAVQRPTYDDLKRLEALSPRERRAVLANPYSLLLFIGYYLPHYVKAPFAAFHADMAEDLGDLVTGKITRLAWIQFRESAKSAFAMSFLLQAILNKWYAYPNVDALERDNSERFLFEVVTELQTNQRIRFDHGEVFNAPKNTQEKTQKRISDFVTTTGVRVESHTTGEPIRGRRHKENRPDLVILDDFEALKTIRSEALTKEVREHIGELKGGLDQKKGRVLYLGNKLSEEGNVASLISEAKNDPSFRVREVWLINDEGRPSWPERHVLTDAELVGNDANKVSIEAIRQKLWDPDVGEARFNTEMLGITFDPWDNGPDQQNFSPLFPDFDPSTSQFVRNTPVSMGVDPAGDGDDETAIVIRTPFHAKVVALEKKSTPKSVAGLVLAAMEEYEVPAEQVVIDSFGVGAQAVRELALLGHPVQGLNVGDRAVCQRNYEDDKYLNDRAYGYFKCKEWLGAGGMLEAHPAWQKEAKAIRFQADHKNQRRIMGKKEIIKRGMKSPNVMDALMLSFLAEEARRDAEPLVTHSPVNYNGSWS